MVPAAFAIFQTVLTQLNDVCARLLGQKFARSGGLCRMNLLGFRTVPEVLLLALLGQ